VPEFKKLKLKRNHRKMWVILRHSCRFRDLKSSPVRTGLGPSQACLKPVSSLSQACLKTASITRPSPRTLCEAFFPAAHSSVAPAFGVRRPGAAFEGHAHPRISSRYTNSPGSLRRLGTPVFEKRRPVAALQTLARRWALQTSHSKSAFTLSLVISRGARFTPAPLAARDDGSLPAGLSDFLTAPRVRN
jgi:hypothetical protein